MWADAFLAAGGVLNWNNGDATITHAAGSLTVDGATMNFNEAGANVDFRVEGDGNASLFLLDASQDDIGFGVAPQAHAFIDILAGEQTRGLTSGVGRAINLRGDTLNDSSGSGTVGLSAIVSLLTQTLTADNAMTYTDSATLYVQSAPTASTNVTATNSYALFVDAGNTRLDGNVQVGGDINPDADGTRDLGTQTTGQWANVWSDLVNGADYGYDNGWRTLEADTYAGYQDGIAFDVGPHFVPGDAARINHVKVGEEWVEKWVEKCDQKGICSPVVEGKWQDKFERQTVTDLPHQPVFVVTDTFIEYKGRRITPEILDRLLALAK